MNEGLIGLFGRVGAGGIKSIQHGVVSISNPSAAGTATINAVNPAKAFVLHTGTSASDNSFQQCSVRLTLANATTITASCYSAPSSGSNTGFIVVEFY